MPAGTCMYRGWPAKATDNEIQSDWRMVSRVQITTNVRLPSG